MPFVKLFDEKFFLTEVPVYPMRIAIENYAVTINNSVMRTSITRENTIRL